MELVRSLVGSVSALKKTEGGKNTNLFFKGFLSVPMCISRPNREKWSESRVTPLLMFVMDSKTNAPSST